MLVIIDWLSDLHLLLYESDRPRGRNDWVERLGLAPLGRNLLNTLPYGQINVASQYKCSYEQILQNVKSRLWIVSIIVKRFRRTSLAIILHESDRSCLNVVVTTCCGVLLHPKTRNETAVVTGVPLIYCVTLPSTIWFSCQTIFTNCIYRSGDFYNLWKLNMLGVMLHNEEFGNV